MIKDKFIFVDTILDKQRGILRLFIWTLVLTISTLYASDLKIGSCPIAVKHSSFELYGDKGEDIEFTSNGKTILAQTLDYKNGKCRAESYQKGNYGVDGDKLNIYLFWDYLRNKGVNDAPYGGQIVTYEIDKNCTKLTRVSSKLYIEAHARYAKDSDDGMKFLFQKPKNDEEQKSLDEYLKGVEKVYGGKFVFGDEAKKLLDSVNESFFTKARNRWRSNF